MDSRCALRSVLPRAVSAVLPPPHAPGTGAATRSDPGGERSLPALPFLNAITPSGGYPQERAHCIETWVSGGLYEQWIDLMNEILVPSDGLGQMGDRALQKIVACIGEIAEGRFVGEIGADRVHVAFLACRVGA